jgi:hypothetical protein
MSRTIRTFGLWSINSRKGAHDKRVFSESRNGDWPPSLFQRKVGVRLFPRSVYRRSFARMGEWKGFFMTHAAGAAQKRLLPFICEVRRDLDAPTARFKLIAGAGPALTSARGHVALWSPHLRFLRKPPCGRLLARIYVKVSHNDGI